METQLHRFEVHRQRQMLYCSIGKRRKTDPCITHHRHRISLHPVASVVIPSSRQEVCASRVKTRVQALQPPGKGTRDIVPPPLFRVPPEQSIPHSGRCHLRTCSCRRCDGIILGNTLYTWFRSNRESFHGHVLDKRHRWKPIAFHLPICI